MQHQSDLARPARDGQNLGMATVRCGNIECSEQPEIDEPSNLAFEERMPCPVCSSRVRSFSVQIGEGLSAADSAPGNLVPGDSQNATIHAPAATIGGTATVTAEGVVGSRPPRLRVTSMGLDITHGVTVYVADLEDRPDSPCVIEVRNLDGALLVTGAGETAADAIASMFEHMLPPDSSEYLPPEDSMPSHDE